jgi:hypothetical protein
MRSKHEDFSTEQVCVESPYTVQCQHLTITSRKRVQSQDQSYEATHGSISSCTKPGPNPFGQDVRVLIPKYNLVGW